MRLLRLSPFVTALSVVLVLPSAALACSCATTGSAVKDARAILERSDAAFIGVLKSVRTEVRQGASLGVRKAVFRYRVKRAYGAKLGRFVKVHGGTEESSCGLVGEEGRKYALGLAGSRGDWTSNLCQYMSPKALRKVGDSIRRRSEPMFDATEDPRRGCGASAPARGWSLRQIAASLDVALSSVSVWTRDAMEALARGARRFRQVRALQIDDADRGV